MHSTTSFHPNLHAPGGTELEVETVHDSGAIFGESSTLLQKGRTKDRFPFPP